MIGGGLSGVTAALWLSRAGLRVALAEAESIGYGASGQSAGILSLCGRVRLADMEESIAQAYVQTHLKAMQSIRSMTARHGLRFQLGETSGYLLGSSPDDDLLLEKERDAMKRAGLSVEMLHPSTSPFAARTALKLPQSFTLNPLLYLRALAEQAERLGVRIYEHSRVVSVEADAVYTETGSIEAPYIVVATGYPIVNTPGWYFIRLEQRRSKLIRLKGSAPESIFIAADGSFAYRPSDQGAILQVNGQHVGSQKQEEERQTEEKYMNQFGMQHAGDELTAIEAYTPDGLPYIGQYAAKTPNLFVSAGYGGDGLLGSMIAAQAISARILGLPSEGYEIYSPLRGVKDLSMPFHLAGRHAAGLFGGAEAPRCSHMGCRLNFNRLTRLWECPCHGSRYDGIGRVINAPAVRPAQLRGRK